MHFGLRDVARALENTNSLDLCEDNKQRYKKRQQPTTHTKKAKTIKSLAENPQKKQNNKNRKLTQTLL